jgi:hypothetical protein
MNRESWARPTTHEEVVRRAAGRRHYNAVRQARAEQRRQKVLDLARNWGVSLVEPGVQGALARQLGVHRSTISRDVAAILGGVTVWRPCPACGRPVLPPGYASLDALGTDLMR